MLDIFLAHGPADVSQGALKDKLLVLTEDILRVATLTAHLARVGFIMFIVHAVCSILCPRILHCILAGQLPDALKVELRLRNEVVLHVLVIRLLLIAIGWLCSDENWLR